MATMSLVTFISGKEILTDEFLALAEYLQQFYDIEVVVVSDQKQSSGLEISLVHQIVSPGTTKYDRILQLLTEKRSEFLLCVDNDIRPNMSAIQVFLQESFRDQADLSWGRIGVRQSSGAIAQMIKIDKNLSHCIIRPALWKMGWGASVPGQIFLIKTEAFYERLLMKDTVFDDLAIGMCAREYNCQIYYNKLTLGWEKPKVTLVSLLRQRVRWAMGFCQVAIANWPFPKRLFWVLVHGAAYHLLWIVFWGLIYMAALVNVKAAFLLWLIWAGMLALGKITLIPVALFYTVAFPLIHVVWILAIVFYIGSFALGAQKYNPKYTRNTKLWDERYAEEILKQKRLF